MARSDALSVNKYRLTGDALVENIYSSTPALPSTALAPPHQTLSITQFFRLPIELREEIYTYYFDTNATTWPILDLVAALPVIKRHMPPTALLLASHVLHDDCVATHEKALTTTWADRRYFMMSGNYKSSTPDPVLAGDFKLLSRILPITHILVYLFASTERGWLKLSIDIDASNEKGFTVKPPKTGDGNAYRAKGLAKLGWVGGAEKGISEAMVLDALSLVTDGRVDLEGLFGVFLGMQGLHPSWPGT